MQLSQAVLSTLLLTLAVAAPTQSPDDGKFTPESLAPHVAREMVDKSPVITVNTIDKDGKVPVSHIERHISSDSCPDLLQFTNRNGNPILLLSKLNDTFANWQDHPDDVSITIEHPPFHGQDTFLRPSINLFGRLQKLTDLSADDVSGLKQCFARLHRASEQWLNDINTSPDNADEEEQQEEDLFFAEFDVQNVRFVGNFGYGEFNGVIDGETYHDTIPPHEKPPCPWHLPPHDGEEKRPDDDNDENDNNKKSPRKRPFSSKKHHGKGKKKDGKPCDHEGSSSSMRHHANKKDDENYEEHDERPMKHHGNKKDDKEDDKEEVSSKKHHNNKKDDENHEEHDERPMKHHGNKKNDKKGDKKKVSSKKHHDNKKNMDRESSDDFNESHRNQKFHHDNDDDDDDRDIIEVPTSQTIFEMLKVLFNHY